MQKINKIYLIIYLTFSVFSFTAQQETIESIYFKYPQPEFNDPLIKFPKEIRGCYYKDLDSLIEICISEDSIYSNFSIIFNIPKRNLIDKNYSIKDSLVFGIKKDIGVPFKEFNDTIYAFLKQSDLFFKITNKNKLKIHDNKYYLNEFKFEKHYNIIEISILEDSLWIKEIDPSFKYFPSKFLNPIKHNFDDFDFHLANPKKDDWINFIKNDGFNDITKFHK